MTGWGLPGSAPFCPMDIANLVHRPSILHESYSVFTQLGGHGRAAKVSLPHQGKHGKCLSSSEPDQGFTPGLWILQHFPSPGIKLAPKLDSFKAIICLKEGF